MWAHGGEIFTRGPYQGVVGRQCQRLAKTMGRGEGPRILFHPDANSWRPPPGRAGLLDSGTLPGFVVQFVESASQDHRGLTAVDLLHPVKEEQACQVVSLVLNDLGMEPLDNLVLGLAVLIRLWTRILA